MGSEDLHKKRLLKSNKALERQSKKRSPYPRILIVCEGEKTEPNYFKDLIAELKLNPANCQIQGSNSKSDPLNVVNFSLEQYNKDKNHDHVFCVFDKDQHANYKQAIEKIEGQRTKSRHSIPIHAITSVPCFEYWLLLHFIETTAPYTHSPQQTAAEQVISQIRKYIKSYHKGFEDTFKMTKANLGLALTRAKKIDKQQAENGTDNPSTEVYKLIDFIFQLAKNK